MIWIPAHTSAATIADTIRSDGKHLTVAEWRANQLADALAKKGAPKSKARNDIKKTIRAAQDATLHAAAQLGVVTHAANNHQVTNTSIYA